MSCVCKPRCKDIPKAPCLCQLSKSWDCLIQKGVNKCCRMMHFQALALQHLFSSCASIRVLVRWVGSAAAASMRCSQCVKPARLWCTGEEGEWNKRKRERGERLMRSPYLPSFVFCPGIGPCAAGKWTPLAANPDLSSLIHHGASSSPGAHYGCCLLPSGREGHATPGKTC